jgi:catechol 2,3-dioxygenase-like lactoylglutathione lyase family enzyme
MIDHVGIHVSDLARSKELYAAALAPLRIKPLYEAEMAVGFGDEHPFFWVSTGPTAGGTHVALSCANRGAVHAFYAAALEAGATDNGAPGLRPDYGENYYAAYVHDHDGNNIEAICRAPA